MRELLAFPNPVNEKAARTVGAGVLVLSAVTLVTGRYWLTIPLAYGFWARVLTGPTLSRWAGAPRTGASWQLTAQAVAARPNGLPSESRQIANRAPA